MTTTSTGTPAVTAPTFVTAPGNRRPQVARTLAEPVPEALGLPGRLGLWGN